MRIRCAIVGCRRSTENLEGWEQWVCARHWRLAPRLLRKHYKDNQKRAAAEDWPERLVTYHNIMWDQIVTHINEAARGIR